MGFQYWETISREEEEESRRQDEDEIEERQRQEDEELEDRRKKREAQEARETRRKELRLSIARSVAEKYGKELEHAGFLRRLLLKRRMNSEIETEVTTGCSLTDGTGL